MNENMTVAEILESLNNELETLDLEIEETEEERNALTEKLNTKRKTRTRLKNRIKNVNKNLLGLEEEEYEQQLEQEVAHTPDLL